jgi:RNA polymerase sigma-70 factor, ECF subfamily
MKGKAEVSAYFGNYSRIDNWRVVPAAIEGRAGLWVHESDAQQPSYPIVLEWDSGGSLERIRDFRYARYVTDALPR